MPRPATFSTKEQRHYEDLEKARPLRRLFRHVYGEPPLEYLLTLRVNYAKRLLRESPCLHYTVAQIATMSGFSDISYFSRIFKKRTGLSPRAYVQQA